MPESGITPRETAKLLRINAGRVRSMIRAGTLRAVNVGTNGRDRFVVLPEHLRAFIAARSAATPPKPERRRKAPAAVDYYPD
jgi:excisionase family DNA binding protein